MSDLKNDSARAADIAEILKALSHPIRLMIVAQLCGGEAHVSDLTEKLALPQSLVSQQLRILRMANLVQFRRENGFAVYRLAQPHLVELLHCLESCRAGDN